MGISSIIPRAPSRFEAVTSEGVNYWLFRTTTTNFDKTRSSDVNLKPMLQFSSHLEMDQNKIG